MTEGNIHPSAIVESGARLGKNVTVEPYAIVKKDVTLGDNVTIKSHAYVDGLTTIGEGSTIWPFACLGTKTQDLKYQGAKTHVTIGKGCDIREYVTINSSTFEGTSVSLGDHCLIMAACHIAHDCHHGNHVIMSNNSLLAGHVTIEDYAIISGMIPIHQYVRIGTHAYVGGQSRVGQDVPPYTIGGGIPYALGGINRIGLKRRQFSFETRRALSQAFRLLYRKGLHLDEALAAIEDQVPDLPEVRRFVDFCRTSKRGIIGLQGVATREPAHA